MNVDIETSPPRNRFVEQRLAGLKLVTVDLDDTLWPLLPTLESAERRMYEWLQQHAPRISECHDFDSLKQHRMSAFRRFPELAHDVTAIRHRLLCELCNANSYSTALADEALAVFLDARCEVHPYTDAHVFLQKLVGRYQVATLTNGNADVKKTALGDYIGFAHSAATAGAAKPDPLIFRDAIAWANVDPGAALHIGDDPELDIMAARAVGMSTVWVNRSGQGWPSHLPPPDLEVASLACERLHASLDLDRVTDSLPCRSRHLT